MTWLTPSDYDTREHVSKIADENAQIYRDAIDALHGEPAPVPAEHGDVLGFIVCAAILGAICWGLLVGPALLGWVMVALLGGVFVWEIVRHLCEFRRWLKGRTEGSR